MNTKYGNSYTITETFSVEIEEESFDLVRVTIEGESLIDVYLAYYPDTTIMRNFTEVNWESGIMEYVDVYNEETGSEYVNKEESILFEIRDYSLEEMFNHEENSSRTISGGPRFWGWSCGSEYEVSPGSGQYFRTCCYRVLGLKNGCDIYGSSDLPGNNPKILD